MCDIVHIILHQVACDDLIQKFELKGVLMKCISDRVYDIGVNHLSPELTVMGNPVIFPTGYQLSTYAHY